MAQLADEVVRIVGADPGRVQLPLPQDDPVRRQPDITRARNVLGWEPTVPLAEGLARQAASQQMARQSNYLAETGADLAAQGMVELNEAEALG